MRALFVTVDGGGNLPPALGIAREIVRRGGSARFLGHEPQRRAVERAGFPFAAVRDGRPYDAAAPRGTVSGLRELTAVFADRGIGADAIRLTRDEPTDVVIVDCLLLGAIDTLVSAGLPTVSLVHTLWSFFEGEARGPVGAILRLRGIRMKPVLHSPRLSRVTVRADFEPPGPPAPPGVHHVGPVWQDPPRPAAPIADRPRVLVSLSTTRFPGQDKALQRILDALGELDVEAIVVGRALHRSARAAAIRAAVRDLLTDDSYRAAAGRLGAGIRSRDGAAAAVDLLRAEVGVVGAE